MIWRETSKYAEMVFGDTFVMRIGRKTKHELFVVIKDTVTAVSEWVGLVTVNFKARAMQVEIYDL